MGELLSERKRVDINWEDLGMEGPVYFLSIGN